MSRYIFPPELMAKFYDGNATAEETMMILHAAEKDPKLKEEIEFMYSFPEDLMDVDVSREEVKSAKIISIPIEETLLMAAEPLYDSQLQMTYLPMWRLAAQSKAYGQDMKAPNDCVVQCEQYVLQQFNIRKSIEDLKDLSKKNRWLKEGGTPLHHIGRLLSEHQLSVVRRYDCNIDIVNHELSDGCKIIVAINAEKLNSDNVNHAIPNHAVVVISINNQEVRIFDPQNAQETSYPIIRFINAWKDSHYYIVSVTKRGIRKYEPAPIDASNFQLPEDLDELIEAIAENNHDVWAKQRKLEGIEYGPVRDEKHNPDLVPYSDLPESEKEYDRKAARGILELVQRLGYKIEKDKK
jgi:hypothetical protein